MGAVPKTWCTSESNVTAIKKVPGLNYGRADWHSPTKYLARKLGTLREERQVVSQSFRPQTMRVRFLYSTTSPPP